MHDESDCRLGLLKSTKTNSGSANKIILSVQCNNNYVFAFSHSFRLILLSVLRRMPLQEGSNSWNWWSWTEVVVGGDGDKLNSALLLCSLLSEDTEGLDCLENKKKSSILKVKLNWFLRQNNIPDVPTSFRQKFSKKSRNHFDLTIFFWRKLSEF